MEKKKMKQRRMPKDDQDKPTKEEYAVAKCLRFSAPSREGKFSGNNANYFMGSKIVDFLLDSQWSVKKAKSTALFSTRPSCVSFCSRLLSKGFFCRVEKQERRKKGMEKHPSKEEIAGITKRSKQKKELSRTKKLEDDNESPKSGDQSGEEKLVDGGVKEGRDDSSNEDKKRKKKPPKLNLHEDQRFLDGPDLYVWLYDPVPMKTFVIGLLLVVGAIGVCLFPLWPPEIKLAVYYLSCAAIGFIVLILSLCVIRLIVFVLVWLFSMGEVSLWLLPNLTEDVGFLDSFRPLYKLTHGSLEKEKSGESYDDKDFDEEVKDGEVEDQDDATKTGTDEERTNNDDAVDGDDGGDKNGEEDYDDDNLGDEQNPDDEEEEEEEQEVGDDEEDGNESYEVIDPEEEEEDGEDEREHEEEEEEEEEEDVDNPGDKKNN